MGVARPPYHDTGDRAHRRPAAALRKPALHDLYEAGYAFIRPDRTVAWRGEGCGEAEAAVDAVCGAAGG